MKGTVKLLKRDWTLILGRSKETILPLFFISILFACLVLFTDMDPGTLPIFCGTMFAVSAVQQLLSFLQLDLGGVFPHILTLPVKQQVYRRSRYLLALLLTLALFLLMPILSLIMQGSTALLGHPIPLYEQNIGTIMAGYPVLSALLFAVLLPCFLCGEKLQEWFLRYGGPLTIMLTAGGSGFMGVVGLLSTTGEPTETPLSMLLTPLPGLIFSLVVLCISWILVEVYHRRKR